MIAISYSGADGCPLNAWKMPASERPVLVLMHGGGPDHRSLIPLAKRLSDQTCVVLPDVRGYGRSVCTDPARHTWAQYAHDVVRLLDHLRVDRVVIGGAGLGATVALRTALDHADRVRGLVLISVEDIEDDTAKAAEIKFMDAYAQRMRVAGVGAAWAPILPTLSPVIGVMVREALGSASPESLAAAAAIGRDRAFRSVEDLLGIDVPTLLFAGSDWRHPAVLARMLAERLPRARLGAARMTDQLKSIDDFAEAFAPEIATFLDELMSKSSSS